MVKEKNTAVLAFGFFAALLVLLSAFFTDRNGWIDEIGLYNPPYMLANFGALSYPIYGVFKSTIVHPPVHLGFIGYLMRWGFSWYYAEAVPTALFFLIGIVVVVRGAFPVPVKLGLLFSIAMVIGGPFALFGTRPDGHVHAAWFAGLVILESGRLDDWNLPKLFFGAFVLTWASAVHYYAFAACTGVLVYVLFAIRSLGWNAARNRVIALLAGACCFGLPYLALYVLPNVFQILSFVRATDATAGVASALRQHLQIYKTWSQSAYFPIWITKAMALRIPLMVFSTAILASIPSTRVLAFAALPLQFFICVFAGHKPDTYLMHEIALFAGAVCVAVLTLIQRLLTLAPRPWVPAVVWNSVAVLLASYLCIGNPVLAAATVSTEARVHEGDVARAAARNILGPHARVAGRMCMWYASGADHWYDLSSDLLWYEHLKFEPKAYFTNFDAIAEDQHMSDYTSNGIRATLSSWYADGTLRLKGFFFGEVNPELQFLLLSPNAPSQVKGYGLKGGQLYRFEEFAEGDYQVVSAACPATEAIRVQGYAPFLSLLYLPNPRPGTPAANALLTVLVPKRQIEPVASLEHSCRIIDRIPGVLFFADRNALVSEMRKSDAPMHFDRALKDVPGYTGAGLLGRESRAANP
jgi:hypothetical protein